MNTSQTSNLACFMFDVAVDELKPSVSACVFTCGFILGMRFDGFGKTDTLGCLDELLARCFPTPLDWWRVHLGPGCKFITMTTTTNRTSSVGNNYIGNLIKPVHHHSSLIFSHSPH